MPGTKMNYFNELDSRVIRDRIDLVAAYEEWRRVSASAMGVLDGSMGYERRGDREYLYRRTKKRGSRVSKSLGVRSEKTDAILSAFLQQREDAEDRLRRLSGEIDRLAAVMRALGHTRMPSVASRVLRRLDDSMLSSRLRVVGTFALYAYEAAAAVVIDGQHLQTGDMDILVDDRSKLQLVLDGDVQGLEAVVRSVDRSFEQRGRGDYRLTNKDGFMVEFIRPAPTPFHRSMPGQTTGVEGDVVPAMIDGLQWLVSAPQMQSVVIDDRGYPVRMTVPTPVVWAAHKLWVSEREDRDPARSLRDRRQADLVCKLISERLPQERFDPVRHAALPRPLAEMYLQNESPSESETRPGW